MATASAAKLSRMVGGLVVSTRPKAARASAAPSVSAAFTDTAPVVTGRCAVRLTWRSKSRSATSLMQQPAERISTVPAVKTASRCQPGQPSAAIHSAASVGHNSSSQPAGRSQRMSCRYSASREGCMGLGATGEAVGMAGIFTPRRRCRARAGIPGPQQALGRRAYSAAAQPRRRESHDRPQPVPHHDQVARPASGQAAALLAAHAQWRQGVHRAGGDRPALRAASGQLHHQRPAQPRVPVAEPEQQDPGRHRPRRAGRQAAGVVRERCDPGLHRRQDRPSCCPRTWRCATRRCSG